MKLKLLALPLLMIASLASCANGGTSSALPSSSEPAESEPAETSSALAPFSAYTLAELHTARTQDKLSELKGKRVSIKGKITLKKTENNDNSNILLAIQNGKDAVLINTNIAVSANVGDVVEAKGSFTYLKASGEVFYLDCYKESNPDASIQVINEAIEVEEITSITSNDDLKNYNSSKLNIDVKVLDPSGTPTAVSFVAQYGELETSFNVAYKMGYSERMPKDNFTVGSTVKLHGIFEFTRLDNMDLLRYYDNSYVIPANAE